MAVYTRVRYRVPIQILDSSITCSTVLVLNLVGTSKYDAKPADQRSTLNSTYRPYPGTRVLNLVDLLLSPRQAWRIKFVL